MLSLSGNRWPDLQLSSDGENISAEHFTYLQQVGCYSIGEVVDPEKIMQKFCHEKHSIRMFHAQRHNRKIRHLCRQLEDIFSCTVQANIYLSPPNAQGFKMHFDTHPVFAVQIQGKKLWKIFDSAFPQPYHGEFGTPGQYTKRMDNAKCISKQEMCQGDMLFIPRGMIHEVYSGSQPSIHITFGILQITGHDLISGIMDRFKDMSIFRELVPNEDYQEGTLETFKDNLLLTMENLIDKELEALRPQFSLSDNSAISEIAAIFNKSIQ